MSWLIRTFGASIGKKLLMAITGLGFFGFLCAHLAGNLTLYKGGTAFNTYAQKLHSLGPILTVFELGLLAFAIIHVTTGILLFVQNFKARSVPYKIDRRARWSHFELNVDALYRAYSSGICYFSSDQLQFCGKDATFDF